jgi:hypothetical protein
MLKVSPAVDLSVVAFNAITPDPLVRLRSFAAPVLDILNAPALVRLGVVTDVENVGLLIVLRLPQLPPVPKVMLPPPPLKLPVPAGHVIVVLPWTAVPAVEP